jgi:hypothetical protein
VREISFSDYSITFSLSRITDLAIEEYYTENREKGTTEMRTSSYYMIRSLKFRMIYFPLGNNSLFNTFHSIEILPGPVNKRLMDIAIDSELINIPACLSNGPPTNPGDSHTIRVASYHFNYKTARSYPCQHSYNKKYSTYDL